MYGRHLHGRARRGGLLRAGGGARLKPVLQPALHLLQQLLPMLYLRCRVAEGAREVLGGCSEGAVSVQGGGIG